MAQIVESQKRTTCGIELACGNALDVVELHTVNGEDKLRGE
jgi:hypothetical protein